MSISDTGVGRTEPIGVSTTPVFSSEEPSLPLSAIASQLALLNAAMGDLRARIDVSKRRANDAFAVPRPPPAPPYGLPLTAQFAGSVPSFISATQHVSTVQPFQPLTSTFQPNTMPIPSLNGSYFGPTPTPSFGTLPTHLPSTLGPTLSQQFLKGIRVIPASFTMIDRPYFDLRW
ncbi:hypothetical protein AAHA92_29678 [Salvia divinorum]|uniref:Uncharacterized protein n=1 Tax=Salvia divinorum TaxID=28513 RepID=A0ABD1FZ58_SALDI